MKQVQAVIQITKSILGSRFLVGQPILNYITDSDKEEILNRVIVGLKNHEIHIKHSKQAKLNSDKDVRKYAIGMINNWFKKAKELNGNSEYKPSNPGIRKGSADPMVREMRRLKKQLETAGEYESAEIVQKQIDEKLADIEARRVAVSKQVDVSKLPDNMKKYVKAS